MERERDFRKLKLKWTVNCKQTFLAINLTHIDQGFRVLHPISFAEIWFMFQSIVFAYLNVVHAVFVY